LDASCTNVSGLDAVIASMSSTLTLSAAKEAERTCSLSASLMQFSWPRRSNPTLI
jgi:hypothetical protein